MADIVKLRNEVINDPLVRGYSGMTDQQVTDDLNSTTTGRIRERISFSSGEVMESIDGTEFAILSVGDKSKVDRILGLGAEVIIGPGNTHNALQELLGAFGGASVTVANLTARRAVAISRANELKLGIIRVGEVTIARS